MKIIADVNIPFIAECLEGIGQVITVSGRDISPQMVKDADALLVRSITKVNGELLSGSSVKFVATATIGIDHIDTEYLRHNNIGFASAPGSNANSVAEYIVCGLLNIEKKYSKPLAGSPIGVIGVGNVGTKVAAKCQALGMKVVLNDPPLARKTGEEKYRPLEELYDCDFLTLHTPLTKTGEYKTYHLADEAFFDNLKNGATFINSSRGSVNDNNALKKAVKAGKFRGSILDVWENEPNIDCELLEAVDIATPHIAGYSYDGKIKGMIMVYEAMCRHFGLPIERNIEEFLPEPDVKDIDATSLTMLDTVAAVYDITADDKDMRQILAAPDGEKGAFFDSLRKNYPCRREFQNTLINCDDTQKLQKLAGIGFAR